MKQIPNKYQLTFLAIFIIAVILRLAAITTHSMWWDELQSMNTANPANSYSDILKFCKDTYDPAPRAFYLVLNTWFRVFGYNDLSARLLVVLFGIGAIPVMYQLGKELKDKQTGLIAAFITAINYYHIYYSLDVRFYGVLFFLSALSYLFFIRSIYNSSYTNLIGYVVSTLLMIVVHYFALLILVAQILTYVYLYRVRLLQNYKIHLRMLYTWILIGLSYLPFIPGLFNTLSIKTAAPVNTIGSGFFASYFYAYFGFSVVMVILAVIAFLLFLLSFFLLAEDKGQNKMEEDAGIILCCWLVLPLLLGYIRTLTGTPTIAERYSIVVLPGLLMAVSFGFHAIKRPAIRYGFLGFFSVIALLSLILEHKFYTHPAKDDFKGVVKFIQSKETTDKPFYVVSDKNWYFNYYFDQYKMKPTYIDQIDYSDSRFYTTDKIYKNEWLVIDTNLKDIWVVTAHYGNIDKMQSVADTLISSDRFILKDTFRGWDAFAKHFIRKY